MGFQAPSDSEASWDSGFITFSRNPNVDDYTDLSFFYCLVNFWNNLGGTSWMNPPHTVADWADPAENDGDYGFQLPNITTTVDTFAKSFYSLLLSDFGVVDQTNALLTPAGVQWLGDQADHSLALNTKSTNYSMWGSATGRPRYNITNAFDNEGAPYPINQAYKSVVDALGAPPDLNSTPSSTI